jgi:hypothetical protein
MSTTGSKAGTRITLVAATYTDITTEFEALGDAVYVISDLTDWEVGLVTAGQTPTALPDINAAGAVRVEKTHESTLDVWAVSVGGGDIWLVAADKYVVTSVTGTTSS